MSIQPASSAAPIPVTGATRTRPPVNAVRYPALDGLRAVAFLMVALDHYLLLPWGYGGVNFFFVLSGFLITGILFDTRDRPGRARSFYLRRTLRIFPLYYGVLVALLLADLIFRWRWSWPWLAWPLYIGNLLRFWEGHLYSGFSLTITYGWLRSSRFPLEMNLGHFWSLCVEEQFYLLWPWLVFGIRSRRTLIGICLAAIVLCPMARALLEFHGPLWLTDREIPYVVGVPFQLDALLLGALLAFWWRSSHRETLYRAAQIVLLLCVVVMLPTVVRHGFFLSHVSRFTYHYPPGRLSWGLSFLNLLGASLLICALRPGTPLYAVLNLRPLRALGRISYGAYVFHDLSHSSYIRLGVALTRHVPTLAPFLNAVTFVLAMTGTFIIAAISFRYFETPFLNLKDRWAPSVSSHAL